MKNWDSTYAHTSTPVRLPNGLWSIEHVRDFSHNEKNETGERWVTCTLDPRTVTQVYFYTMSLAQLGVSKNLFVHTAFSFSFSDGTELIFSVEARRQKGESYDPFFKGLFGGYEMTYVYTTYNDLIAFRKVQRGQSLERYALLLPQKMKEGLVVASMERTVNVLGKEPEMYNSFSHQCTIVLLHVMNTVLEKKIPRHFYWHITGLSPRLLAKHGLLDLNKKETV